jgi:hypothetical protein
MFPLSCQDDVSFKVYNEPKRITLSMVRGNREMMVVGSFQEVSNKTNDEHLRSMIVLSFEKSRGIF